MSWHFLLPNNRKKSEVVSFESHWWCVRVWIIMNISRTIVVFKPDFSTTSAFLVFFNGDFPMCFIATLKSCWAYIYWNVTRKVLIRSYVFFIWYSMQTKPETWYCLCYLFSLLFRPSLLKALDVQIRKFSGFLVSFEIENKRTIWLLVKASLMFMIMVQ